MKKIIQQLPRCTSSHSSHSLFPQITYTGNKIAEKIPHAKQAVSRNGSDVRTLPTFATLEKQHLGRSIF